MTRSVRYPIFLKLAASVSLLIVVLVAVTLGLVLSEVARDYEAQIRETGTTVATLLVDAGLEPIVMRNFTALRSLLEEVLISNPSLAGVQVFDSEGVLRVAVGGVARERPGETTGSAVNLSSGREPEAGGLSVSQPVEAYGRRWGEVRIVYRTDGLRAALAGARRRILLAGGVATLAGLLIAGLIARAIAGPTQYLAAEAKRIATGELGVPIEASTADELGVLAASLEQMRVGLRHFAGQVARRAIGMEGNLDLCPLPVVLALLHTSRRTGALLLQARGQVGVVYVLDGEIVDAAAGRHVGEDAFWPLLTWVEGTFKFSPNLVPQRRRIERSWEGLILEGTRRIDDPRLVQQAVPTPDFVPAPAQASDRLTLGRSALLPREREVLDRVDGRRSVAEIATLLDMGADEAATLVYRLVSAGLICGADENEALEARPLSGGPGAPPSERTGTVVHLETVRRNRA